MKDIKKNQTTLSLDKIIQMILASDRCFQQETVYADCAGVHSPTMNIQGNLFNPDTAISQLYLNNFENSFKLGPIMGTGEYMAKPENMFSLFQSQYAENNADAVMLPKPRKLRVQLNEALYNRQSSRFFDGTFIPLQNLSDLLFYSAGCLSKEEENILQTKTERYKRPYPSGGGMYATQLLLVAYNIEKLQPAIYSYQPVSHSLRHYSEILPLDTFIITKRYNQRKGIYEKIENQNPSALIICVNNFLRQRLKYGELSLLLALIDCGCMLQNISLLASSLSMHYCIWAGFKKTQLENALKIDGIYRHAIMTSLLGGKI